MTINEEVVARLVCLAGRSNVVSPNQIQDCDVPSFGAEALILIARAPHSMMFAEETCRVLSQNWPSLNQGVQVFARKLFDIQDIRGDIIVNIR